MIKQSVYFLLSLPLPILLFLFFSIPTTTLRMLGQMNSFFSFFSSRRSLSSIRTGKTRRQMVSTRSPLSIHSREVAHTHAQCTLIGQREQKNERDVNLRYTYKKKEMMRNLHRRKTAARIICPDVDLRRL